MKIKKTLEDMAEKVRMSVLPIAVGIESSIATGTSAYYLMKAGEYVMNGLKQTGHAGEIFGYIVGPALPVIGTFACAYFGIQAVCAVNSCTRTKKEL